MASGKTKKKRSRRAVSRSQTMSSVIALSKEFASSTSMHGIKYIAQENATILERILWVVLFLVGFFLALFFSWNLWKNWETSPVLITIQTANFPMTSKYPFPTVTICSVNKVSTRALGEWMSTPEGKHFQVDEIRSILRIISTSQVEDNDTDEDLRILSELMKYANISNTIHDYQKLVSSISPNCSDMAIHCTWEGKEENCSELFATESTDNGYCCSFNSIIPLRNSSDNVAHHKLRYAKNSGVYAGLSVILDSEIDDYNVTSSLFTGFKVSIQDPDDFPRTSRIGFMVSPGHQIEATVTGTTQISNERLRSISLEKRLCTTNQEIKLKHFDKYTGPYCQLDCLIDHFLRNCSCIPYYIPVNTNNLTICDLSSYRCLGRIDDYVISHTNACKCPDECDSVWYQTGISSGNGPNPVAQYPPVLLKRVSKFQNMSRAEFNTYAKTNIVKLNVFFKTTTGLCFIMDQRTTWADFISATGGLLGLGFGFSILSAAEIVYFILIRWFYYWFQTKKTSSSPTSLDSNSISTVMNNYSSNVRTRENWGDTSVILPRYETWSIVQQKRFSNNLNYQNPDETPHLTDKWFDS